MHAILHASYFSPNFGDVLLWHACINRIKHDHPELVLRSVNVPRKFNSHYCIQGVHNITSSEIRDAKFIAFLGGGYFYQPQRHTLIWGIRNYLRHSKALQLSLEIPKVGFFGVGVGEIDFSPFQKRLRAAFSKADVIIVRDMESKLASRELLSGCERPIHVVPDIAFGYVRAQHGLMSKERRYLSLHIDPSSIPQANLKHILDFIHKVARKTALPLQLLVDCPSSQATSFAEVLKRKYGQRVHRVVTYAHDVDDFLAAIAASTALITTKLHVGICSTALGIPTVSIPKHQKTKRFYEQIGLADNCVSATEIAHYGFELLENQKMDYKLLDKFADESRSALQFLSAFFSKPVL